MKSTLSASRTKAHVARVSSFDRSAVGWKVQSKPSKVLPTGKPLLADLPAVVVDPRPGRRAR